MLAHACEDRRRRGFRGAGIEGRRGRVFDPQLDRFGRFRPGEFGDNGEREIDPGSDAAAGNDVAVANHPSGSAIAPKGASRSRQAQWVAARLPRNNPAAPSTNDPVHTEVTNLAVAASRRNSAIKTSSQMALSVAPGPPGTQTTSHAGISESRLNPANVIPPVASTAPPSVLARITLAPGRDENASGAR